MGKKRKSLLGLLGAGLIGITSLFTGGDAKAQSADELLRFYALGSAESALDGRYVEFEHNLNSKEAVDVVNEDIEFGDILNGMGTQYKIKPYNLEGGYKLEFNTKPRTSESLFNLDLALTNISGSASINLPTSSKVSFSGKDTGRNHLVRFYYPKESIGELKTMF